MAEIEIFNPATINTPRGTYSHVAEVAPGAKLVMIAGQVAIDKNGNIVGDGFFEQQCAQVYENIGNALKASGGDWKNVVQFMSFLTRKEDIPRFAAFRKQEMPRLYPDAAYPPNTLLVVQALASDEILLEVQAIAAI
jgi:2-iminobutanoate/2-iminopropanoate deaminase